MKLYQVISDLDSNLRAIVWANSPNEAIRIAWECADETETFFHATAKEVSEPEAPTMLIMVDNDLEQFSEERLKKMTFLEGSGCVVYQANEVAALARIALAAKQAKPVGYMYRDNLHSDARFSLTSQIGNWSSEEISEYEITEIPLYTTPQPAHTEQVPDMLGFDPALAGSEATVITNYFTPDGWKLVPIEPTYEMKKHYYDASLAPISKLSVTGYRAMLASAPKPESER